MVFDTELERQFSVIYTFGREHIAVLISGVGAALLIMTVVGRRKKKVRVPLIGTEERLLILDDSSAQHPTGFQPEAEHRMRYLLQGATLPKLPLPDSSDIAYASTAFGAAGVSARSGWNLYSEGHKEGDLRKAMTGLRLWTQYIAEGGDQKPWSPSGEYRDLGEGYETLAKAHASRECLALAYDAYVASYLTLYAEPSTEQRARDILLILARIRTELDKLSVT
jgi:hypothetical protein